MVHGLELLERWEKKRTPEPKPWGPPIPTEPAKDPGRGAMVRCPNLAGGPGRLNDAPGGSFCQEILDPRRLEVNLIGPISFAGLSEPVRSLVP